MDVREAIEIAKGYVTEVFTGEGLVEARLEEVGLDEDDGTWNVTIGMVRPLSQGALAEFSARMRELRGDIAGPRVYRVVKIRDQDKKVLSVKMREEVY